MKKKPFDPSLPRPLGKMTRAQLDAESQRFDAPFVALNEMRPPTPKESAAHPKPRRGHPATKPELRSVRVLVTMPPSLLARTDARAKRQGTTRAGLIQAALESLLKRRKSAWRHEKWVVQDRLVESRKRVPPRSQLEHANDNYDVTS